jgi:hypothetical protein
VVCFSFTANKVRQHHRILTCPWVRGEAVALFETLRRALRPRKRREVFTTMATESETVTFYGGGGVRYKLRAKCTTQFVDTMTPDRDLAETKAAKARMATAGVSYDAYSEYHAAGRHTLAIIMECFVEPAPTRWLTSRPPRRARTKWMPSLSCDAPTLLRGSAYRRLYTSTKATPTPSALPRTTAV